MGAAERKGGMSWKDRVAHGIQHRWSNKPQEGPEPGWDETWIGLGTVPGRVSLGRGTGSESSKGTSETIPVGCAGRAQRTGLGRNPLSSPLLRMPRPKWFPSAWVTTPWMQITGTNSNWFMLKRTFNGFYKQSIARTEVQVAPGRVRPLVSLFIGSHPDSFPGFSSHGGSMLWGCFLSEIRRREFWS